MGSIASIVYFIFQLELKLGIGGTSYEDFITSMHLPMQLRYVEPEIQLVC